MRVHSTKQKILQSSIDLFSNHGYSSVSVRDIAKAVGIQAGSIYSHYKAKEDILTDIFDLFIEHSTVLHQRHTQLYSDPDYLPTLSDMSLRYKPQDLEMMRKITRIMYMEQFSSAEAAKALLGPQGRRYTTSTLLLMERLHHKGLIRNAQRIPLYAELFARLGHSFQLDFVHPEYPQSLEQYDLNRFVLEMIFHYEGISPEQAAQVL